MNVITIIEHEFLNKYIDIDRTEYGSIFIQSRQFIIIFISIVADVEEKKNSTHHFPLL